MILFYQLDVDDHISYLHISVGFKDLLTEFRLAFVTEPRGNVVLHLNWKNGAITFR